MALLLVFGMVILAGLVVTGLFSLLQSRTEDLRIALDRTQAQYLCETGVSVALIDFKAGKVNKYQPDTMQKTFRFFVGSKPNDITYTMTENNGLWGITASVDSPSGLPSSTGSGLMRYSLTYGGRRLFPMFLL
jgi:hypothetical protein